MSGFTIDENSKAVYSAAFDRMNKLREEGNEKSAAEAEAIAIELIAHADLPLLYRTQAHMVLGCGNHDNFLWHAEEAVRIVNKGIEWYGQSPTVTALLSDAQDVLDRAKQDYEQLEKIKKEKEAQGYEYVLPSEVKAGEDIEIVKYGDGHDEPLGADAQDTQSPRASSAPSDSGSTESSSDLDGDATSDTPPAS